MASNSGSFFDPDGYLDQVYRSNGARNYWNWSDARLDAMIDRQRTLFDFQQRKAAVREIILYLIEQAPGTGLSRVYLLNALNPQIRGFTPEVWFNGRQYENVWLEA